MFVVIGGFSKMVGVTNTIVSEVGWTMAVKMVNMKSKNSFCNQQRFFDVTSCEHHLKTSSHSKNVIHVKLLIHLSGMR
jgi:hypothetical protein